MQLPRPPTSSGRVSPAGMTPEANIWRWSCAMQKAIRPTTVAATARAALEVSPGPINVLLLLVEIPARHSGRPGRGTRGAIISVREQLEQKKLALKVDWFDRADVCDGAAASYYAKTSRLTVEHYQELLNRGWRR